VKRPIALGILACAAALAPAHASNSSNLTIAEKAAALKPGQYVWQSASAPSGSVSLVINLTAQRVMVYRDGILMAASTISTGSKGRETPSGNFTILEKQVDHRSRTYDNASMPYMQRLTQKGVAMHAGHLPGYAASHGCIRLPKEFARLLFGITSVGTPVMIFDAVELAEQQRKADEYRRAMDDFDQQLSDRRAAAERALEEFEKASAQHRKIVRQREADIAKRTLDVASR